jgi:hypothetical protein
MYKWFDVFVFGNQFSIEYNVFKFLANLHIS